MIHITLRTTVVVQVVSYMRRSVPVLAYLSLSMDPTAKLTRRRLLLAQQFFFVESKWPALLEGVADRAFCTRPLSVSLLTFSPKTVF